MASTWPKKLKLGGKRCGIACVAVKFQHSLLQWPTYMSTTHLSNLPHSSVWPRCPWNPVYNGSPMQVVGGNEISQFCCSLKCRRAEKFYGLFLFVDVYGLFIFVKAWRERKWTGKEISGGTMVGKSWWSDSIVGDPIHSNHGDSVSAPCSSTGISCTGVTIRSPARCNLTLSSSPVFSPSKDILNISHIWQLS